MPPKDPNVLFCNASKHSASYLYLLFSVEINAYVNSNIENVMESSKGNQLLNTFIVPFLCFNVIH